MSTWSAHTLTLLNAARMGPLLGEPFASVLDSSLSNIVGAVSLENSSAGDQLRTIIQGGKDVAVLERASDQCRQMEVEFLVRVHERLEQGKDEAPAAITRLIQKILHGGITAVIPRSFVVGGAAARLLPRDVEILRRPPADFTEMVHGEIDESPGRQANNILNRAVAELIDLDLNGEKLSAARIERLARELITVVRTNLQKLIACLTPKQSAKIENLARENSIPKETAQIEFLANVCLFKVLRDYYGLQQATYLPLGTRNGFILLTENGSLVGSAPSDSGAQQTFHYARMPSRNTRLQTGKFPGYLETDINVGHPFLLQQLRTSRVVEIVIIPPDKTGLFDEAFTLATEGTSNVSVLVSALKGQK